MAKTNNYIARASLANFAVSFDQHIGHNSDQSDERSDYYHRVEERLKFDLQYFNQNNKRFYKDFNVALKKISLCLCVMLDLL